MVEHATDHGGEAVGRHRLKRVAEVPVVVVGAGRDTAAHAGVEGGGIDAPLLACVAPKERLVELASDAREDHLLGVVDALGRLGARGQKARHPGRVQLQAVEPIDRRAVDRDRQQLVPDAREHAVLVGPPGGESAEVAHDVLGVRVEDVRPVLMVLQPVLADGVVGVTGDVRAFVDHQNGCAELGREPFGQRAAGESRADDEVVVHPGGRSARPPAPLCYEALAQHLGCLRVA